MIESLLVTIINHDQPVLTIIQCQRMFNNMINHRYISLLVDTSCTSIERKISTIGWDQPWLVVTATLLLMPMGLLNI